MLRLSNIKTLADIRRELKDSICCKACEKEVFDLLDSFEAGLRERVEKIHDLEILVEFENDGQRQAIKELRAILGDDETTNPPEINLGETIKKIWRR